MSVWLSRIRSLHHFFLHHLTYSLTLASALAVSIFVGRVYIARTATYAFFMWNLSLAWLPYLFSLYIVYVHKRSPQRWGYLILPALAWMLFFPNAPYIVTDLIHLEERSRVPFWYDIGFFATYVWTGLSLGVASLRVMQNVVSEYLGRAGGWLFALGIIGLSGSGIYIGRFVGWNSWDLILQPLEVLADVTLRFAHPIRNPQPFAFTMMFAALILVCYLTFGSIPHREKT